MLTLEDIAREFDVPVEQLRSVVDRARSRVPASELGRAHGTTNLADLWKEVLRELATAQHSLAVANRDLSHMLEVERWDVGDLIAELRSISDTLAQFLEEVEGSYPSRSRGEPKADWKREIIADLYHFWREDSGRPYQATWVEDHTPLGKAAMFTEAVFLLLGTDTKGLPDLMRAQDSR